MQKPEVQQMQLHNVSSTELPAMQQMQQHVECA